MNVEASTHTLDLTHAVAVAAMLDEAPDQIREGMTLPPLWHWFYGPPIARSSDLGGDGHPRPLGAPEPGSPAPRRMWAGGRLRFCGPLRVGDAMTRHSRVVAQEQKQGRSGALTLVTIRHEIRGSEGVAIEEDQDLIYREAWQGQGGPAAPVPSAPAPAGDWDEPLRTDPVLLFRFSALTFNGHRIHYDLPYAREVEGYPSLVVHGPLLALSMLRAAMRRTGRWPATFSYRAESPLFCGETGVASGRDRTEVAELWSSGPRGITMRGDVQWAP